MNWPLLLFAALLGYLCGSISFARVVLRRVAPDKVDEPVVFNAPDGEPGYVLKAVSSTTVRVVAGPRWGCLTGILDVLKVALPTLAMRLAVPDAPYFLVTAYFGLVGHDWPVFYRFRGGRGLSAVTGGMLAIDPLFVLVYGVITMAGGSIMRKSGMLYLGVVSAPLMLIGPWLWWRFDSGAYLTYGLATSATYCVAMVPEVRDVLAMRREGRMPHEGALVELTRMDVGVLKKKAEGSEQ